MAAGLRLRAVDADDLSVIAACLQDALIPLSEMAYLADEQRFVAAFTRFRRECLADPASCAGLTQCQSALVFRRGRGGPAPRPRQPLRRGQARAPDHDRASRRADGLIDVTLLFAGDAAIRLRVREIAATLEDFGEPWPATGAAGPRLAAGAAERPLAMALRLDDRARRLRGRLRPPGRRQRRGAAAGDVRARRSRRSSRGSRREGDAALLDYTLRFDRHRLQRCRAAGRRATRSRGAVARCPAELRAALELAAERIERLPPPPAARATSDCTDAPGVRLGLRWRPIDAVGLYVPGGTAAYPSSVLMNAHPGPGRRRRARS